MILGAIEETVMIPIDWVIVQSATTSFEIEGPQELRNSKYHVSLRQVDARTDPAPHAVSVVIAFFKASRHVVGRKK